MSAAWQSLRKRAGDFVSVKFWVEDRVAHIQLNRPDRYNAIDENMTVELEAAVELANLDDSVKVT